MSEEIKKNLDTILEAQKQYAETLKDCITEEKLKGHIDPLLKAKQEKIDAVLDAAEQKQAAALKAIEDEVNNLKKSNGFSADQNEAYAEGRKAALNRLLRKGLGMENSQPLSLSYLKEEEQKFFSKSMISGNNEDGGFMSIDAMAASIQLLEKDRSPVRSLVNVISGNAPSWKQPVQTGRFGARRVGETEARTETATPSIAEQEITAEELNAEPRVSQTMLDDADFDLVGFLNSEIADEFLITEGAEFVTGNGVKQFKGIADYDDGTVFGTLERVQSAGATLAYSDFVDLDESLLAAYQNGAVWLMNRTTRSAARQIVDGQNRPLFQPDLPSGGLPSVFGKRVVDVPDMQAISSGNLPISLGNFRRGYTVYDRMGIRVLRDPYTAKPFVIFSTTKRSGGDVTDHQAIKHLEMSA